MLRRLLLILLRKLRLVLIDFVTHVAVDFVMQVVVGFATQVEDVMMTASFVTQIEDVTSAVFCHFLGHVEPMDDAQTNAAKECCYKQVFVGLLIVGRGG